MCVQLAGYAYCILQSPSLPPPSPPSSLLLPYDTVPSVKNFGVCRQAPGLERGHGDLSVAAAVIEPSTRGLVLHLRKLGLAPLLDPVAHAPHAEARPHDATDDEKAHDDDRRDACGREPPRLLVLGDDLARRKE